MLKTQQNKSLKYADNPEGRTSIHIFQKCMCAPLRYEKSKILNKGFTLALHCSYPIFY